VQYKGHGLTIRVNFMVNVCVGALDPMVLDRTASVMYGSHAIFRAPALYYKSLETASTLSRKGNILGRLYY
jgi:hypothetical protein